MEDKGRFKLFENTVYELKLLHTLKWNSGLILDSFDFNKKLVIIEWKNSEQGKWILENCKEIELQREVHWPFETYQTDIIGYCKPSDWTYFSLKWL